ncbi:type II secretion system protein GspE [Oceanobacillus piezotolerans]|uniref:Type II secretion system protein GspE n=1 Tax=Oceanobacillus piezotolerans TaxID=2448030 RepID=A0A498DCA2_9BACI|nr:ATPase, T2SS/T4P/T4SS family [Oceanobacillus piezotolerans]RLL47862.1 type II secretion system protein GspE [Oceanobacillus piezotolerans]
MVRKRLGDLLVESGLITDQQLSQTLATKAAEEKLGDALLREGFITEQQLIEVLEFQLGIPHINLFQYSIDQDIIQLVPKELAKRYNLMPIRIDDNKLFVAMADPMDYFAMEELRMATGFQIVPGIATKDSLYRTITKYYDLQESIEEVMGDFTPDESVEDLGITDEDSPIVRLVNQIIANAVAQKASDIHCDPQENELRVRYRVDGVLRTERELPKYMQNVLIARIKIMGNLNITENRLPQDGRIKMEVNHKPVDIRLSTLPAVHGEKIVMRILDLGNALNDINKLGFTKENQMKFRTMIEKPNGIVLITGPTGSGKSSTLYASLNQLNGEEVNIITVEDPVEYQLYGINQVQVREEVGMTFASGLRSILRQDPDIIMIGEIRDFETAQIAVRASLTGHLVLSTLHTNSAVAALSRLIDMGVEPFLISSSLNGVVAQRLVRKVCRDCAETVKPTARELEIFANAGMEIHTMQRGRGCPNCGMTGYRGRVAVHEVLPIDGKIRKYIMSETKRGEITRYARESGMQSLLQDGLLKVSEGLTTTEEVIRVAASD